jgi:hypothetical protein
MRYTLQQLIDQYRNDADSSFLKLQHQVRLRRERLLSRIGREHGGRELQDIRTRTLIAWHREWGSGGKLAMAKALVDVLRVLFRFGASILEDQECGRLSDALEEIRLQNSTSRSESITSEHACAVRAAAHEHFGWHCIALAQALQFELPLMQKDVIGEWVPLIEPGESDVVWIEQKWLRGLRWSEVDENMILVRSGKREKDDLVHDLRLSPMVMEEFGFIAGLDHPGLLTRNMLPMTGPIVLNTISAYPYTTAEFRRKWRMVATQAGVPSGVKNRNSSHRARG